MDRDEVCERFIDAVPFELYPFQEEAVLAWFETEGGLLVTAPTGMGKTLIAETAVFEALHTGRRLYYTTPLIALTDQKMRELQDRAQEWGFSRDDVGLLTGNMKVNPDAPILVVVAEILLNHLLAHEDFGDVSAVVMDEFHYFNDRERGVVWELSLGLLPEHVRLLLLSATVGNALDFTLWLREKHGRALQLVTTDERRVPLDFAWVEDKLLTEHLVDMVGEDDASARVPALVFCFSRDECWEVAERLKGLPLIPKAQRADIEAVIDEADVERGIGPKLRQMLIRGVGVHHAGVLPRHKQLVEELFLRKLIPFVVCTETLAAGVNLPARSVVLRSLLKGKPGSRKVLPASTAHQIFGRAGRPQFDARGWVYALAHEDDVKIHRWKEKYEQLDPKSTNPTILRARKQLERKRPTRRKTQEYWSEAQLRSLVDAKPQNLASRSMIPYRFLLYLLAHGEDLADIRRFLARRFNSGERLAGFEQQLDAMVANLAARGHLTREEGSDTVDLADDVETLLAFRTIDPLFGAFLREKLVQSDATEKQLALEAVLPMPYALARRCELPVDWTPGPLQTRVLEPLLVSMGVTVALPEPDPDEDDFNPWAEEEERPPDFAQMLAIAFDAELPYPEEPEVQLKWVAGGVAAAQGDFYRFVKSRELSKNEGLVLRHLLRLVLIAHEFAQLGGGDPDYADIAARATDACESVDPAFTERYLSRASETALLS